MSDPRLARIRERLEAALSPVEITLEDESALHAGHPGAATGGGHYRLKIVSDKFEGHKLVTPSNLVETIFSL